MKKIASFTVNHLTLKPGVYVSRKDPIGAETVTTFDIRMTRPNFEPVMNTAEMHTLEHLGVPDGVLSAACGGLCVARHCGSAEGNVCVYEGF